MTTAKLGAKVLIVKGGSAGRTADIVYMFYEHTHGMCQMEPNFGEGWDKVYWVVPHFDHCGEPNIVALYAEDFVLIKDAQKNS